MAFCSHCGANLEVNARFCPNCGNPIPTAQEQSASQTGENKMNQMEMSDDSNKVEECSAISHGKEKNQRMREQFNRIQAGQSPKFSVFSMFLGMFQQMYNKQYGILAKTYLPPVILLILITGVSKYAVLTFRLSLVTVVMVANVIGILWELVVSIVNGKKYAYWLYQKTNGNAGAIPSSSRSVVIGCIVLALSVMISSWAGGALAANEWEEELEGGLSSSAQWEDGLTEELPPESIGSTMGVEILQPVEGIIIPAQMPWYGPWADRFGSIKVYEQDLEFAEESMEVLEDGSYQITLRDSRDDTVYMVYDYLADGSMMNAYDGAGNYLTPYFRPESPVGMSLPEKMWGMYRQLSGELYVGPEDCVIVDAYRFGTSTYSDVQQSEDEIYRFQYQRSMEASSMSIQYKEQQGIEYILVLDESGNPYAEFEKIG